ncbi:hypothetical protein POV27_19400 [Aureisphaera galaxeae]|uniref:hypothetical protein n=1 Tax=Aureisphaera galaxeae TaxID=1538023 RepID=UPI002350CB62|nr:hypothetical protein [Aureisphaera galaxeae]MDC8006228.1 hypothetical protein [Aureisphaera galaxeae]
MSFKPAKEIIPNLIMVVLGIIVMALSFWHLDSEGKAFDNLTGIIRVIVALSAACISIALPGFIELQSNKEGTNSNAPLINAGGALAVFVLVYLFNPIG